MRLATGSVVLTVLLASALAPASASPSASADTRPRLTARVAGSTVLVSFDLRADEAPDLARRLASAQPVSVSWRIDVRREVPRWVDRDRHALTVTVRVRPDQATGLYAIERLVDGRVLGAPLVDDLSGAIRRLTSFEAVPLPGAAPRSAGAPHRVSVRAVVTGGAARRITTPVLADALIQP